MRDQNLYELLQVTPNADPEIIQAAYRRLILRYHPDRSSEPNAAEMTQKLNAAYEILNDPVKRAEYDRELKGSGGRSTSRRSERARRTSRGNRPPRPPKQPGASGGLDWKSSRFRSIAAIAVLAVAVSAFLVSTLGDENSDDMGPERKAISVPTMTPTITPTMTLEEYIESERSSHTATPLPNRLLQIPIPTVAPSPVPTADRPIRFPTMDVSSFLAPTLAPPPTRFPILAPPLCEPLIPTAPKFTKGSTKQEVLTAQGTPDSTRGANAHVWSYRLTTSVTFDENGRVIYWNDNFICPVLNTTPYLGMK